MKAPLLHERVEHAFELLQRGLPIERVARFSGIPLRALRVCTWAEPDDVQGVLHALAVLDSDVRSSERQLRGSASWPFVLLAASVLAGAVVWTLAFPALRKLPLGGAEVSLFPAGAAFVLSSALLVCLGLAALLRVQVPGLGQAWRSIDRYVFANCSSLLHSNGVPLTRALRAAGMWGPASVRAGGEAVARSLDAGAAPPQAPLLSPREFPGMDSLRVIANSVFDVVALGVLLVAARSGTAGPALLALEATAKATMRREVPRQVQDLQTIAVVLSGISIAVTFSAFYFTYVRAVTG